MGRGKVEEPLAPLLASNRRVRNKPMQQVVTSKSSPAFLFDLDGTLVDSVYHHVPAWRRNSHVVSFPNKTN
jgi:beta-phosphoglucomutase-like phosphatase (HAD superfamily)